RHRCQQRLLPRRQPGNYQQRSGGHDNGRRPRARVIQTQHPRRPQRLGSRQGENAPVHSRQREIGWRGPISRIIREATSMKTLFASLLLFLAASIVHADELVLVAGGGSEKDNVPATKARLIDPFGIDFDKDGNKWIVEMTGQRLLKIDGKGMLTIAAGTGKKGYSGDDGPGVKAAFNDMHGLAVHPSGVIYLADTHNNRIRKFDPKSGEVTTF